MSNKEQKAQKLTSASLVQNGLLGEGGKIIVSSKGLVKLLYQFLTPLIPVDDEFEVKVECLQNEISFNDSGIKLCVESRNDFVVKNDMIHLRNLFRVLTKVPEQPLIVTFKDYDWITVDGLVV